MPLFAIHSLLILSGAVALVYQVVWVRLLSLSISSTSVSVSVVVGAFFIGMALGSELTTRLKWIPKNYFDGYILVETLIALSAICLLPLLVNLDKIVISIPFVGQYLIAKIVLVTFILIVPTTCMGASFPLFVNALAMQKNYPAKRLGHFYGINTFGAVLGAVSVGFVLIPGWGLEGAIYTAVILNITVILITIYYKQHFRLTDRRQQSQNIVKFTANLKQKKLLGVLFVTGFVSLSCEVTWTKYLSIYTHTTIFGFSAILGIFLAGISLGAITLSHYFNKIKKPINFLIYILIALSISLVVTRVALEYLPWTFDRYVGPELLEANDLTKYLFVSLIVGVPTLLFGASFSLCLELICNEFRYNAFPVGRVYSVNIMGGILGITLTGLWIIPVWGSDVSLMISALLITLLPFLIVKQVKSELQFLPFVAMTVIILNIAFPHLDYKQLISSSQYYFDKSNSHQEPTYQFIKEGRSGVVSVSTYDNKLYFLKKNNLTEAAVYVPEVFNWRAETLLALLPYFLLDDPKSAFIVGLGAGTTLSAAALTGLGDIDIVEMDPLIEQASRYIYRDGIAALNNPKVNYSTDDARHRLLLNDKRYDIIISQPSHPWLSGNAHLFTQEYFQIVKSRLNKNGVFSQWLNLFNLDATTLKAIFRAMYNVFPYGINFKIQNEGSLLLLASNQPISFDQSRINQKLKDPAIANVLNKWNITTANDLLPYFSLSRDEANRVSELSRPNTDMNLISEVRLAKLKRFPLGKENPLKLLNENFAFDIDGYLPIESRREMMANIRLYFANKGDRYRLTRLVRYQSDQ